MGNSISDVYINLNNALDRCNEAFAARNIEPANTLYEIGDRIELLEVDNTSKDAIIAAIISGTVTEIPDENVSRIDDYVFAGCPSLKSANLPLCSYVGYGAFHSCTSLTSVNLPACSHVDTMAFYNCTSLTSTNLPVCEKVGQQAFERCTSLTSINLPICSYIDDYAFYYCTALSSITLGCSQVVNLNGNSVFYKTSLNSIYVPASLVDAYKVAGDWVKYASNIIAMEVPENEQ